MLLLVGLDADVPAHEEDTVQVFTQSLKSPVVQGRQVTREVVSCRILEVPDRAVSQQHDVESPSHNIQTEPDELWHKELAYGIVVTSVVAVEVFAVDIAVVQHRSTMLDQQCLEATHTVEYECLAVMLTCSKLLHDFDALQVAWVATCVNAVRHEWSRQVDDWDRLVDDIVGLMDMDTLLAVGGDEQRLLELSSECSLTLAGIRIDHQETTVLWSIFVDEFIECVCVYLR